MALEDDLKQVEAIRPGFRLMLDTYAETGESCYENLLENELEHIKMNFGRRIYNEFCHIYESTREVVHNEK